ELGVRALAAKGFSRKLQQQFEVEIRLARKRKLPAADVPGAPVRRPMRPSKAVVDARYVREYYLAAAARLAMLRHRLGRQAGTPWMSPELPAEVKKRLKNKKINNVFRVLDRGSSELLLSLENLDWRTCYLTCFLARFMLVTKERCAAMRLPIRWRSGGDLPWLAKLGNLLADAPMPTAYRPVGRGITREKFKSRALLALKQFLGE
ncbi:unnamed protein product, partial [Effrenium voratum]